MSYYITDQPIDTTTLLDQVRGDTSGAIATFHGIVRKPSRGRDVLYLEYAAYESMARNVLEQIGAEVSSHMEVDKVLIAHRTGRLEIGETSIFIAVAAPHRQAALEGCRYIIERVKQILPVWKKEVWEGGEEWIQGA
ncbi:molybdenum cofactor biosynthesis protein MoaE [candidate division KSB3 bacterium]|jgi:molybdopterin synthase catalytic subunit|uniref:Molybdenum cofactor biosynthesis protein MoaE n=1 Tax=candidate division KSB3 bacterium TaxID=2044937 RepID=A0A9D5Q784_9BACT|nr:molybdenum cofactor biosynthesis protein MoaE [candidate division KSB3 bacterium]MBD3326654.1 molybdenum cofactor biosynthesis protein MoaE [candidate division KSB3 bacterium]